MRCSIIALCALVAFSSPARADIELYGFDKQHTQILFSVGHLGFSTSHGAFRKFEGSFEFNRSEPQKSKVDVTIDTASVDMGDKVWDDELKGGNFFDIAHYPAMHFVGRGVTVTGDKTGKVVGDLTLHGVTKPVELDVTFNKADKHPFSGKYVAGFSAHTLVHRSDFDMAYGTPFVSDDVDIDIEVEGIRQGKGTENE